MTHIRPYEYVGSKKWEENKREASDPSTSIEILVLLIDQHPFDVWDNLSFKLQMLLDPQLTFLTEHAFRRLMCCHKVATRHAEFPDITLEGWKSNMIRIGKLNPG